MKKLIQFSVVAAIVALSVACGGPSAEDQAKKQQDSIAKADSMKKAAEADSMAKAKADTTKKMGADSAKAKTEVKK